MRLNLGETRTASIGINIKYKCSSCGKSNLSHQRIEASDFTPAIWGVTLGNEFTRNQAAREALQEKFDEISDKKNPHRFSKAAFDCECEFCGHREPWARMNYSHLALYVVGSFFAFLISLFFVLITRFSLFFLIVCALSASVLVGFFIYRAINNKRMMKLTATLPSEALPTIVIPDPNRHKRGTWGVF